MVDLFYFLIVFGRVRKKVNFSMLIRSAPKSTLIEPLAKRCPPQLKNENTTFVAYKAPKIKAPRPAPNYQRNTRKKD